MGGKWVSCIAPIFTDFHFFLDGIEPAFYPPHTHRGRHTATTHCTENLVLLDKLTLKIAGEKVASGGGKVYRGDGLYVVDPGNDKRYCNRILRPHNNHPKRTCCSTTICIIRLSGIILFWQKKNAYYTAVVLSLSAECGDECTTLAVSIYPAFNSSCFFANFRFIRHTKKRVVGAHYLKQAHTRTHGRRLPACCAPVPLAEITRVRPL